MRVHPYITPTLTAALLSAKREKGSNVWREGTRGGKKSFLVCGGAVSIDAACLPPHVVVIVSWRSQSGSWVLSVFACHLVSCGGTEEKRTRGVQCISQEGAEARVFLCPENQPKKPTQTLQKINKIKNGSWEQRKKSLPYACIENYTICCYPNIRELWFSRNWIWGATFFHLPFQVFVWRAGIEILPLLHYFQHTWRASSSTAEHM